MSITFHCEHCGNKISAKKEAAGKRARCPACHNKIYVPDLNAEVDDLKLAPIDEDEETRRKQLIAETQQITLDILSQTEEPKSADTASLAAASIDEKKLEVNIISYLRNMADKNHKQAKILEKNITPYRLKAQKILDKIAFSKIPEPELANIPQTVLSSLIKKLRSKIS